MKHEINLDLLEFNNNLLEHNELLSSIKQLGPTVVEAIRICRSALSSGGKILFCGNGGSAADSQHLAAELTGKLAKVRKPIAAIAITTDSSALTCISNDFGFDQVFARQVEALGNPGDCLIAISTSGNSKNIIEAVNVAKRCGLMSIGFIGMNGGALRKMCDLVLMVPSHNTARIQEVHILIGHTICGALEREVELSA